VRAAFGEPSDACHVNDSLFENGCADVVFCDMFRQAAGLVSGKLRLTGLSAAEDVRYRLLAPILGLITSRI